MSDHDGRSAPQRRRDEAGVTDAMIDAALSAYVPGGSHVSWWLPMNKDSTPHETARDVVRCALEEVIVTYSLAPKGSNA